MPRLVSTLSNLIMGTTILCIAALPCANSEESLTPQAKEYLRKLEQPITLRGDYFKAALVAYNDFSRRLSAAEAMPINPPDNYVQGSPKERELRAQLAKIENYDMSIEQSDSAYTVQIGPTLRGDMPLVFGGGARYQIDKKTFSIVSKTPVK